MGIAEKGGLNPVGALQLDALRHRTEGSQACLDMVAEEHPVALVFNGISHAVMMTTPSELEYFATGFALSEGIVSHAREIYDVEIESHPDGVTVHVDIAQAAFQRLKAHRRTLAGRTGCGVCGTESLQMLDLVPERVGPASIAPDCSSIERILADLPARQSLMQATGCAHAAAWCAEDGEIFRLFEDVGRHNALDKLLGWMSMQAIDPQRGFVFLSSRASYELVRKVARCGVPVIATISAPTSLAIRIAQISGVRLLSFCRNTGFVEYPSAVN